MDLCIKGKKALITGGGRGIGRSIAQCLAEEGVKIAVVSRTESDITELVKELGGEKEGHMGIAADLMPEGAPTGVVEQLKKEFGEVDILVHNLGGTLEIRNPFCPIEDWQKIWRFNFEIMLELNLLLLPYMREKQWGRILSVSSIAALENQGPVTYCSVKAALTAYTRSMGRVLAPQGIVVAAVLPGAVMTEGGYWDIASREKPEHVEKYLVDRMAIHRFGRPEEIGRIAAFLCSEHASFCIGSNVLVDGGQGRCFSIT